MPPPPAQGTNAGPAASGEAAVVSKAVPMMLGTKAIMIPAPSAVSPIAIFWNAMPAIPAMAMIMPTILPQVALGIFVDRLGEAVEPAQGDGRTASHGARVRFVALEVAQHRRQPQGYEPHEPIAS